MLNKINFICVYKIFFVILPPYSTLHYVDLHFFMEGHAEGNVLISAVGYGHYEIASYALCFGTSNLVNS